MTVSTALLLVDIQNDYFPGGNMELENSDSASSNAQRLLACFREMRWPVVHIQHIAIRPGATFFLPDTRGADFHDRVRPLDSEIAFQKHYPNAFRETPLLRHLQAHAIQRLVIAGMMTHMCIDATTRAAYDYGFQCLVAHDACATRALRFADGVVPASAVHLAFLAALDGTFAQVLTTQDVLIELGR
jgi:nicotinamidase-related amidase